MEISRPNGRLFSFARERTEMWDKMCVVRSHYAAGEDFFRRGLGFGG
jgi:hypothetical protein